MDLTRISGDRRITCTFNVIMLVVAFAATALAVTYFDADLTGFLLFLLYFFFYLQLPGMMVLKWMKAGSRHVSTNIITGFFLGWILITAEYFLTALILTNIILYIAGPVLSLIYIYGLIRNRKESAIFKAPDPGRISKAFMLFATIALIYAMLFSQFRYVAPESCGFAGFPFPDNPFHMGILTALADGFPPKILWLDGKICQYHYFSEMLMAIPMRLFGLKADFLVLSCTPYLVTFVFSTALYSFYIEFVSKKSNAGLYCLITLLANLYMKGGTRSGLWLHVFGNVNNSGYGIAAAMVTLVALKRMTKAELSRSERVLAITVVILMVMLTTGIKGPMGAVLVAAIWGTFILALILRKGRLYQLPALVLLTAGFAVVYVFIIGAAGQGGAGGGSLFAIGTITDGAFYKHTLISALKDFGIPEMLRKCILLVVFLMFAVTVFFLPYVIGYIRELILVITGKKEYDFARIAIYASSLVGLMAMLLLNFDGHSQAYFGFLGICLSPIIGIFFLEELNAKSVRSKTAKALFIILMAVSACVLAVTTVLLVRSMEEQAEYAIEFDFDSIEDRNRYLTTSNAEYKAMEWLDQNTPKDALMATNRYESKSPEIYSPEDRFANTYFAYCIYSHRYFWFEGAGYSTTDEDRVKLIETNDRLFDAEDTGRDKLVKDLGIDYVVASKRFKEVGDLEDETYRCIYDNEDVIIYKIIK